MTLPGRAQVDGMVGSGFQYALRRPEWFAVIALLAGLGWFVWVLNERINEQSTMLSESRQELANELMGSIKEQMERARARQERANEISNEALAILATDQATLEEVLREVRALRRILDRSQDPAPG